MGQQSTQAIAVVIGLLSGAVLGATIVWLAFRRFGERARKEAKVESQTELALLNERLASAAEDLGKHRAGLAESESQAADLRNQLDVMRGERADLDERAARVPALEAQLSDSLSQLNSRQEENTRIAAQLAERTHDLEALQGAVAAQETERKGPLESLEALRARLEEETNRTATLAEQSARLPELETALNAAAAERKRLSDQLANLHHQLRTAESALAGQKQRAERLELEVAELNPKRDHLAPASVKTDSQVSTTDETSTTSGGAEQRPQVTTENETEPFVSGEEVEVGHPEGPRTDSGEPGETISLGSKPAQTESTVEPTGEATVTPSPPEPLRRGRGGTAIHVDPLCPRRQATGTNEVY
jgi:predicted nuclease with TOPRIM domain